MSVIKKIDANIDTMSPADREIGSYIANNPDELLNLSSAQLAERVGRSQSSVVKFTQRLGYSTYQDLKISLSAQRAQKLSSPETVIHGSIAKDDGLGTIFEKLLTSKYRTMRETVSSNPTPNLEKAMEILIGARHVYLTAVGASSLVALDFTYKLQKIGRVAIHNSDAHVMMANVSSMSSEDVLIIISYSGRSAEALQIGKIAKLRNTNIIALTGLQINPIAKLADVVLHTVADEDQVRSSSITARDAQLALTDLLFLGLIQKQDNAQDFIKRSEIAVGALKSSI